MPDHPTDNPLLTSSGLPPFDKIAPQHVGPAVKQLIAESSAVLDQLEQQAHPEWNAIIPPLDEIGRRYERSWGPVSHLFGVKNSPELRTAYEAALPQIVEFGLRTRQSEPIYRALKGLREGENWARLDSAQQRIVEHKLRSAELAGIGLSGAERQRFNAIAQELSQLSTQFSNHVLDATKAWSLTITDPRDAEGLPMSLRRLASQSYNRQEPAPTTPGTPEQGPWRITLDIPSYGPFMQHCRNASLREQVYRAFVTRASSGDLDNSDLCRRILQLRQEQARLLGFQNYAEVSLAEKMAPNADAVLEMLERLRTASWEPAQADMQEIHELALASGQMTPLRHWDVAFWAERLRERKFSFTDEDLRPYFSHERVLQGLFDLLGRLFEVTIERDPAAPVWNEDVRFYRVLDASGTHIASFYYDPYSRPENKRGGAWMDDCLSRRVLESGLQVPVAYLVCNCTPPVGDKPSLMTFREVETLFHEFGHGLQHMLTKVDYPDAAGI
ncbi:MAG: M3 family metallopeptidase, partial [Planctomycetaceae bacterium]